MTYYKISHIKVVNKGSKSLSKEEENSLEGL
jgi:hypothetical protein